MKRTILAAAVAAGLLFALVSVTSADHAWSVYHWPDSKLDPTVKNLTKSSLYDVPAAVAEWSALGTPIQPAITSAKSGDITVREGFSPFWLGLARVYIDSNGHITRGEVYLNTKLLKGYPPAAADHVACQELGHILGLDHNRAGDSSPNDNTCMNDQVNLKQVQYPAPNQHDTDELNLIYGHADAAFSGPGGSSANGQWVTVHVYPVGY